MFDGSQQAITASAHRLNKARRLRVVAQNLAQLAHGGVEAVFEVYKGVVGPKALMQFRAGHQLPGPLGQRQQQAARLLLQADGAAILAQVARAEIESERSEAKTARDGCVMSCHGLAIPTWRTGTLGQSLRRSSTTIAQKKLCLDKYLFSNP